MSDPTHPRPFSRPLLVALLMLALSLPAVSQDDDPGDDDSSAGVEDRARVGDLVRSLNNPVIWRIPSALRDRIDRLLSSRDRVARASLREILRDTGAQRVIVEQLVNAVLVHLDDDALKLVDDVVERLRIEQNSELARSLGEPLLRYANSALVERLAALAVDHTRSVGYRKAAVATLGRTGHSDALRPLLAIWSDDGDPALRLAASRAFVDIVPFVDSVEQADAVVRELEEHQIPLAELLRRRLRHAASAPVVPAGTTFEGEYRGVTIAALPHLPLRDVVGRVLASPLPDLRAAGAARLREFPYDAEEDPAGARIAAAKALLLTLRHAEVDDVEAAVLAALAPLAAAVRENVGDDDMAALEARVRTGGRASLAVRLAAIDLVTALADPRPIPLLEEEFDALGDTDSDLRIELLDALAACNGDLTGWLLGRVLDEPDVRVLRHMVGKLALDPDPAAEGVFETLLARRDAAGAPAYDDIARFNVVQALGQLWTRRGSERARDIVIRHGLVDPSEAVRQRAASVLATPLVTPWAGDRSASLAALQKALSDEAPKVREEAARGILDLDSDGALARLGDTVDRPEIWDLFRTRRVEDLRGGHVDVDDVLRETQALWDAGDARRPRALQLLRAVAEAGTGLWEARSGRGKVRETLAERLLASGEPADACKFAEALVAEPPRDGDPRYRWRLLLGRALRACGQVDRLERAVSELSALRADPALPVDLHAPVDLELGDALLGTDPTKAAEILEKIVAGAAGLSPADQRRLEEKQREAAARRDEERALVLSLVGGLGKDATARARLVALGYRAARHLMRALDAAADAAVARPLLAAAAVLTGETYDLPATATPAQVAEVVGRARTALGALVARATAAGSR